MGKKEWRVRSDTGRVEFKFDVWRGLRGLGEAKYIASHPRLKLLLDFVDREGVDTLDLGLVRAIR